MGDRSPHECATKTEQQIRSEFAAYFLDLKESMAHDGGCVNKSSEWDRFVARKIEEGEIPNEASKWKCPRSLVAEMQQH